MAMTRYQGAAAGAPTPESLLISRDQPNAGRALGKGSKGPGPSSGRWLELDGAGDPGDGRATDPDIAAFVLRQVDAAAAADHRALAGDVRELRPAGVAQPAGHCRVQAPGDRVLANVTVLRYERPHLERLRRSGRVRADHADVHRPAAGFQRQYRLGAFEEHGYPAGTVVGPGDIDDLGAGDPEHGDDLGFERFGDRAGPDEGRRREAEPTVLAPEPDQASRALLDDLVVAGRYPAGLKPGVAGAEGRVTGEREFGRAGEDPDLVVGLPAVGLRIGGKDERRLGQVRPAGE